MAAGDTLSNPIKELVSSLASEHRATEVITLTGQSSPQYTTIADLREMDEAVFYIDNASGVNVTVTPEACPSNAAANAVPITTTSLAVNNGAKDFIHLTDFHPYVRMKIAWASGTPAGTVTVRYAGQKP